MYIFPQFQMNSWLFYFYIIIFLCIPGVALKQLTSFICQLKENDEDDETSGEDA